MFQPCKTHLQSNKIHTYSKYLLREKQTENNPQLNLSQSAWRVRESQYYWGSGVRQYLHFKWGSDSRESEHSVTVTRARMNAKESQPTTWRWQTARTLCWKRNTVVRKWDNWSKLGKSDPKHFARCWCKRANVGSVKASSQIKKGLTFLHE